MWKYAAGSLLAVVLGFLADAVFGDPQTALHPICLIGNLIAWLEKQIRNCLPKTKTGELVGGGAMAMLVILSSAGIPAFLLCAAYRLNFWFGVALEAVMCFFLFAVKTLRRESANVARALREEGLEAGQRAVARIVGRDTQVLDEPSVIRAAVETVAENFSDGVFAPMLYMMIGGGVLGFAYKSVNTMDSMVGYRNDRYLYFGRIAASDRTGRQNGVENLEKGSQKPRESELRADRGGSGRGAACAARGRRVVFRGASQEAVHRGRPAPDRA